MILFDLKCGKGHVFEAWFRDGTAAEKQLAGGKVACPACGSAKVQKAPMAPRIGKGERRGAPAPESKASEAPAGEGGVLMSKEKAAKAAELRRELGELRSKIEANCDYVGGEFAEEARKIHYGETEARGIYGETSEEQARELTDEGIEFSRVPWLPRQDS
jgi:hypothetical protein